MTPVKHLTRAAYGIHFADQIALVSVPLVAALVFDASAVVVGVLIACQSMAHLLGSLPFGILVDTRQQRTLVIGASLVSLVGLLIAAVSVYLGFLIGFGASVVLSGFGIVLFMLATLSIIPKVTAPLELSTANASIELPRALASFFVPLSVGILISEASAYWLFPIAAIGAAAACKFSLKLPEFERAKSVSSQGPFRRIVEGGSFVVGHDMLRAILLCALFWNFAFSALLVTMIPLIRDVYLVGAGTFGIALAAFGGGAIVGSWTSRRYGAHIPPNVVLLFGPAVSVVTPLILLFIAPHGSIFIIYAAFFLIGFGPSMWLIAQNSVRQTVSPGHMLGRVNAVIQTAIYGIRPIAALVGGAVIEVTSPNVGLLVVFVGFALSFPAAAMSGLRHVKSYADLETV